jgi:O-antigen ligase
LIESFIGLAIAAWLVKKITLRPRPRDIFRPNFLNLPIVFYLVVGFASAIFSTNKAISFTHLFLKTSEYLLLFFVTVEALDRRVLRNILAVLTFSVTLVGIDGIYQYFTKHDFIRNRTIAIAERPERIHGPFTMPTDFANYLITLLPLVASIGFLKFKRKWLKFLVAGASLMLFVCIVLSVSKSAWVALILAIPFTALLGNKKLFIISLGLILIVLSLYPFLSGTAQSRIKNFLNFNEGAYISHRQILWKMALEMLRDRPLLGQGIGSFMDNFRRFQPKDYPENWEISYTHNCFLQIAAEQGILGFLSFILIITLLFFISFKKIFALRDGQFYYYVLSGLTLGIFTYLVGSIFDTNLYSLPLAVLFWLMAGLAVGTIRIIDVEAKS